MNPHILNLHTGSSVYASESMLARNKVMEVAARMLNHGAPIERGADPFQYVRKYRGVPAYQILYMEMPQNPVAAPSEKELSPFSTHGNDFHGIVGVKATHIENQLIIYV